MAATTTATIFSFVLFASLWNLSFLHFIGFYRHITKGSLGAGRFGNPVQRPVMRSLEQRFLGSCDFILIILLLDVRQNTLLQILRN